MHTTGHTRLLVPIRPLSLSQLADLVKALKKVKEHQRKLKDGTVVTIASHYRNYMTKAEKAEMVKKMAQHMADGKAVSHKTQAQAKSFAKAASKHTGKDVHVYHDGSAWVMHHDHPGDKASSKHVPMVAKGGKLHIKHPDMGEIPANALLMGKPLHKVGKKTLKEAADLLAAHHGHDATQVHEALVAEHKKAVAAAIADGKAPSASALKVHEDLAGQHAEAQKKKLEAAKAKYVAKREAKEKAIAEKAAKASEKQKAAAAKKKAATEAKHKELGELAAKYHAAKAQHGVESDEAAAAGTKLKAAGVTIHENGDGTTEYKAKKGGTVHVAGTHVGDPPDSVSAGQQSVIDTIHGNGWHVESIHTTPTGHAVVKVHNPKNAKESAAGGATVVIDKGGNVIHSKNHAEEHALAAGATKKTLIEDNGPPKAPDTPSGDKDAPAAAKAPATPSASDKPEPAWKDLVGMGKHIAAMDAGHKAIAGKAYAQAKAGYESKTYEEVKEAMKHGMAALQDVKDPTSGFLAAVAGGLAAAHDAMAAKTNGTQHFATLADAVPPPPKNPGDKVSFEHVAVGDHVANPLGYVYSVVAKDAKGITLKDADGVTFEAAYHSVPALTYSDKKPGAQMGNQNAYKGGPKENPHGLSHHHMAALEMVKDHEGDLSPILLSHGLSGQTIGKAEEKGVTKHEHFGVMAGEDAEAAYHVVDHLHEHGFIAKKTSGFYPGLVLTDKGKEALGEGAAAAPQGEAPWEVHGDMNGAIADALPGKKLTGNGKAGLMADQHPPAEGDVMEGIDGLQYLYLGKKGTEHQFMDDAGKVHNHYLNMEDLYHTGHSIDGFEQPIVDDSGSTGWKATEETPAPAGTSSAKSFHPDTTTKQSHQGEVATVSTGGGPGGDGMEVKFPAKPPDEVKNAIKALGFKWSKFQGVWYKKKPSLSVQAQVHAIAKTGATPAGSDSQPAAAAPAPAPAAATPAPGSQEGKDGDMAVKANTKIGDMLTPPGKDAEDVHVVNIGPSAFQIQDQEGNITEHPIYMLNNYTHVGFNVNSSGKQPGGQPGNQNAYQGGPTEAQKAAIAKKKAEYTNKDWHVAKVTHNPEDGTALLHLEGPLGNKSQTLLDANGEVAFGADKVYKHQEVGAKVNTLEENAKPTDAAQEQGAGAPLQPGEAKAGMSVVTPHGPGTIQSLDLTGQYALVDHGTGMMPQSYNVTSLKKPGGQPGNQNAYKGGPKDEPAGIHNTKIGDVVTSTSNGGKKWTVVQKHDNGLTVKADNGSLHTVYSPSDVLVHTGEFDEEAAKNAGGAHPTKPTKENGKLGKKPTKANVKPGDIVEKYGKHYEVKEVHDSGAVYAENIHDSGAGHVYVGKAKFLKHVGHTTAMEAIASKPKSTGKAGKAVTIKNTLDGDPVTHASYGDATIVAHLGKGSGGKNVWKIQLPDGTTKNVYQQNLKHGDSSGKAGATLGAPLTADSGKPGHVVHDADTGEEMTIKKFVGTSEGHFKPAYEVTKADGSQGYITIGGATGYIHGSKAAYDAKTQKKAKVDVSSLPSVPVQNAMGLKTNDAVPEAFHALMGVSKAGREAKYPYLGGSSGTWQSSKAAEVLKATYSGGLTGEHQQAIKDYQNGSYSSMNGLLRKGGMDSYAAKKIGQVDDAMAKAQPIDRDMTLMRGKGVKVRQMLQAAVGKVFTDEGYHSTTISKSVAKTFAKGPDGVVIHIRVPKGTKGLLLNKELGGGTLFHNEAEYLLPRGTSYIVHSVEKGPDGYWHADLEMIDNGQLGANHEEMASWGVGGVPNPNPPPPPKPWTGKGFKSFDDANKWAMGNAANPANGHMDAAQEQAAKAFAAGAYHGINGYLQGGSKGTEIKNDSKKKAEADVVIHHLSQAIANAPPTTEDVTLHKTMYSNHMAGQYQQGSTVTDEGFAVASATVSGGQQLTAAKTDQTKIEIEYHVPKGSKMAYLGNMTGNAQNPAFALPKNAKYHVKHVEVAGGVKKVQLELKP